MHPCGIVIVFPVLVWKLQMPLAAQSCRPHGSRPSMILLGTIPETPISHEWSGQLERPLGVVPTAGRMPTGGFANSTVRRSKFPNEIIQHFQNTGPCSFSYNRKKLRSIWSHRRKLKKLIKI